MFFEARYYMTGWAFRVWLLQIRFNRQDNYKGLSIEWVKPSYFSSGGMTWKEFRLAKGQRRDAARVAMANVRSKC